MHFLNGPGYEAKIDIADAACTMSYTIAHSAIQCCVLSWLNFEAAGGSIVCFVQLFASSTLSRSKHHMGTHSGLNAETLAWKSA